MLDQLEEIDGRSVINEFTMALLAFLQDRRPGFAAHESSNIK